MALTTTTFSLPIRSKVSTSHLIKDIKYKKKTIIMFVRFPCYTSLMTSLIYSHFFKVNVGFLPRRWYLYLYIKCFFFIELLRKSIKKKEKSRDINEKKVSRKKRKCRKKYHITKEYNIESRRKENPFLHLIKKTFSIFSTKDLFWIPTFEKSSYLLDRFRWKNPT